VSDGDGPPEERRPREQLQPQQQQEAPPPPPPPRWPRLRAQAGAGLLVIAALAAGGAFTARVPDTDAQERPFVRAGRLGERVDARTFDATVVAVRGGTSVERTGRTRTTGGVWVLARVRLVARQAPVSVDHAALRDGRGRMFLATTRLGQPLVSGGHPLQPGIVVEGEIVFEVPRDAATGRLAIRLGDASDARLDAVAEVPLGIEPADVARWLAERAALRIADAEVGVQDREPGK
jgi:hypothetical protein